MAIKYINIFPPKLTQIGIFGLKTNHLATLISTPSLARVSLPAKSSQGFLLTFAEKSGFILLLCRCLPLSSVLSLFSPLQGETTWVADGN
jgi:hypothetical protein